MISDFFSKNLDVVFMIYGLGFVAMGIAILTQPRRESVFKLADVIWILAGFGLTHGLNEWLDMFSLIAINKYLHGAYVLGLIRLAVLSVSYVFLFEFGRRLISFRLKRLSDKWVITAFLCFVVMALMIFIKQERSVWPRYFLGFPGGVFAALGFIWYYYDNETILKPIRVRLYFITAAVSLCVYGILGGVVVPKTDFFPASIINTDSFFKLFGIPVQVFRAICSIVLAWAVWNVLNIFSWEIRDKLKKSLVDLTIAKNYVDNILKSMISSVIVVGTDKKIKTINPATLTLLGYDKDELIGMPVANLFTKEWPRITKDINIYKTCVELFKEYSVRGNEVLYKTKGGRPIAVLYTCSNIIGKDGQEEGCVISAVDITERKKADEALKFAYQQLKETQSQLMQAEKMEVVGTIASGVAHEVKNPLAIILQSVEYLSKKVKTDDENVSLMIGDIKESVERADKIIRGLLDFSGISTASMGIENPNSVVEDALRLIKSQLLQSHIEIIKNLGEDMPSIKMDRNKIEQALVDLFINAMHAMPGGGTLTVRTFSKGLEGKEKAVIVQIEDTGCGIPTDILDKIFNPFFTTRQAEGGTGLGLSIVKSIVEQHNGKIEIQNRKESHGVIAEVTFKVS